jgi:hypothetical protein
LIWVFKNPVFSFLGDGHSKGSTYMAAIWAKKIKIKVKAAFTTFSFCIVPNFQPRVVNFTDV